MAQEDNLEKSFDELAYIYRNHMDGIDIPKYNLYYSSSPKEFGQSYKGKRNKKHR